VSIADDVMRHVIDQDLRWCDTPAGRLRATAQCSACTFRVQMTGDDAIDIANSLRRVLVAHFTDVHQVRPS
jgi:hypothetical protein